MPEIPDKSNFTVNVDQIRFTTQTNGDSITIKGVHLGKDDAAALSYLINHLQTLKVEVKEN